MNWLWSNGGEVTTLDRSTRERLNLNLLILYFHPIAPQPYTYFVDMTDGRDIIGSS